MITSEEMRKLEDMSEKKGITKLKLMENAGYGLFVNIQKRYPNMKILVICGSGNNGGDGFVLARYLRIAHFNVNVFFLGKKKFRKEADFNYKFLRTLYKDIFVEDPDFKSYDVLVDAMLGTGVKGKIREPISSVIDKVNKSKKSVIAVDIPSGLNPDTGEYDKMINADIIYTFHDTKSGLKKFQEKVEVIDIGIPKKAIQAL